jgi:hypothetical protein
MLDSGRMIFNISESTIPVRFSNLNRFPAILYPNSIQPFTRTSDVGKGSIDLGRRIPDFVMAKTVPGDFVV